MEVELYKKFKCEKLIEELDALVSEASNLFEDGKVSGENISKLDRFELLLLDHLLNRTNFEKAFDELLVSYGDFKDFSRTIIFNFLNALHKKTGNPSFSNLLEEINNFIAKKEEEPLKNFSYYIPTRIEYDLKPNEVKNLNKKLKKVFNLTAKKLPKNIFKQIKSEKFRALLSNRQLILRIDVTARDYIYPIAKIVDKNILGFLGILALAKHYQRSSKKWSITPDRFIEANPLEDYLIIVEDNKNIVFPRRLLTHEVIDKKDISMIGKTIWNIHNRSRGNYKMIISGLDLISKSSIRLKPLILDSLKLYFEAIIESTVELSFLKFWIVSENIAKYGRKLTDDSLKSIFRNLVNEGYSKKMIDRLHRKRNDLVHEFKINHITQNDRNFIKLISEGLILILIDPPTKINNGEELKILFDNFASSKDMLKNKKRIITKFIKLKDE